MTIFASRKSFSGGGAKVGRIAKGGELSYAKSYAKTSREEAKSYYNEGRGDEEDGTQGKSKQCANGMSEAPLYAQ